MKRSTLLKTTTMLALLLALALGSARAEDFSRGILDPQEVLKVAQSVTVEAYPNADDVLVDDFIRTRYQADGTDETWDDTFMKVLTEKGRRENSTLSFHFTLPTMELDVPLVQIIKADGTVVDIDVEKQGRVMVDPGQSASNIYNPNSKVFSIGVPGLEIGDMVRYVSHRRLVQPRVPNTWSDYNVLEYTSPIKRLVIEVHGPKELPLTNIALKDAVEGTVRHERSETDEEIIYRWTVTNVPRMYREPNMPPLYSLVQRLLVSTIPTWQDVSKWYWNLSERHLITNEAMEAKVAELLVGKETRQQRIESIFYWVSQQVRYMGITVEAEAPGYEPHPATMTFDNRHGVCRDKAALLVTMLRTAGFKAYPVLIHNGPKKDKEVPQPFFNHAIVAVEEPDGSYQLMDMTDENTREILPAYLSDKSYLVAKPEGEDLLVSAIVPAAENMVFITSQGRVNARGDLTLEVKIALNGINDNAYRGYFSRIKPEQRREYFQGIAKRVVPGAKVTAFELRPANMLDTSESLSISMTVEAKDILVAGDETAMLPVPIMGQSVGMVNFILSGTGLEKRDYPLVTDFACGVEESVQIELDPALGKVEKVPFYPTEDREFLFWERSLDFSGPTSGTLEASNRFLLKVVEFSPEEYLGLKETLQTIEHNNRKMPILTRSLLSESEADVIVELHEVEYDLVDARNWQERHTLRQRVLTYNGVKDSGEIHLSYNPVWEEVELVSARVDNNGEVKVISEQEKNIMDAPWVASAPRYPAEKTLVASLPGVEVGSIVEYSYIRRVKDQPFFSMAESFQSTNPLLQKSVRLSAPKALKLTTWRSDMQEGMEQSIVETNCEEEGRQVWTWTAQEMPALKSENNLPPLWSFTPAVMVSTGTWSDWARRVEDALDDAARENRAARAMSRKITKGMKSGQDRARAIRDYMAINIRQAGPGLPSLPLGAVTAADTTLEDRYGNTTDRAVLLHAMLSAAGFRPEFVLASGGPELDSLRDLRFGVPHPGLFPTVLVRVEIDKKDIYLNDTSQYAFLGATSYDDKPGLDLDSSKLITIHAPEAASDRAQVLYEMAFSPVGDVRIRLTRHFYGNAFESENRRFVEMPPEERARYFQQMVTGISQSAKAEGDMMTDFSTYPGVLQFTVTAMNYGVRDGEFFYFRIPASLGSLLSLRSDERVNPLYWSSSRRSTIRTLVTLPAGFQDAILSPSPIDWQAPADGGSVVVQEDFRVREGSADEAAAVQMEFVHSIDLKPAVIPASDYDELLEMNTRLSHDEARTVLLQKTEQ